MINIPDLTVHKSSEDNSCQIELWASCICTLRQRTHGFARKKFICRCNNDPATVIKISICKLSTGILSSEKNQTPYCGLTASTQIAAAISFRVYACFGCSKISSRLPISTALPSFMTIIRSDIARTAFMSCEIKI